MIDYLGDIMDNLGVMIELII